MTPRLRALALGVLLCSALRLDQAGGRRAADSGAGRAGRRPRCDDAVSTRGALQASLDEVLAQPAFARAQVALVVRSLATGETLYRRNGATWLVPASTMKVLTAVAAAERLGWGYRFETRLVAMGPVVDGTLRGDLLVVGGGDPSINPRHDTRVDAFDDWARALKAQGIVRIAGHVVGDDSAIEQPGWGIGWAWDDLVEGYGAAYAALQYHEGEVEVTIGPGATPGAPAVVYLSPSNHGLLVDNRAVTAPAGGAPALSVARDAGHPLPRRERPGAAGRRARDRRWPRWPIRRSSSPTSCAPTLQRHGIVVDGAAADIDDLSDRPRAADGAGCCSSTCRRRSSRSSTWR